ncbi:MAG: T9SS type A sorting domain-containing protein, partial [Melioribacteraceae bacterium]|nr:T9SS type A sorting domain-containing protein [Melioribacteraceae bacterium]
YWVGTGDEQIMPPSWEGDVTNGLKWQRVEDAGVPKVFPFTPGAWHGGQVLRIKQQEEGTKIDKIYLTNDINDDPTPENPGVPGINEFVFEAEDYDIVDPNDTDTTWMTLDESEASGGQYIWERKGGKNKKYVGYSFTTTSSDTIFYAWVKTRAWNSVWNASTNKEYINWSIPDSIIARGGGAFPFQGQAWTSNAPDIAIGDSAVWKWHLLAAIDTGVPYELNLKPGDHNFFLRGRQGGVYDQVKITNNLSWRPDISFTYEAEDGTISPPLMVDSVNGLVVTTPGSGTVLSTDLVKGNDDIAVQMLRAEGDYYVWLLVDLPSEASNSYWIGTGDEQIMPPSWEGSVTTGLEWQRVEDDGNAKVFSLTKGAWDAGQVVRIKQQEEGTKIDKIYVTNDIDFVPQNPGVPGIVTYNFEAEDYTITDPADVDTTYSVVDDGDASEGKALLVAAKVTKGKRYAGYSFEATSSDTNYHIWVKTRPWNGYWNSGVTKHYVNWSVPDSIIARGGPAFPFQGMTYVAHSNEIASGDTTTFQWFLLADAATGEPLVASIQPGSQNFFWRTRGGIAIFDQIKITNDLDWRPDMSLEVEAESGTISDPLIVEFYQNASLDSVVSAPIGSGTIAQSNLVKGNDDILVAMTRGVDDYYLWVLVDFPSESSNSYWIGTGDEQIMPPSWEGVTKSGLKWQRVEDNEVPRMYNIGPGAWHNGQVLRIKQQEEGTKIDKILLTNDIDFVPDTVVSVAGNGNELLPKTFEVAQNYPNPFNPSTIISYALPKAGNVEINIYNIIGQKVTTLVKAHQSAGNKKVEWNASNLSSGIYFYSVKYGDKIKNKKMLLIK